MTDKDITEFTEEDFLADLYLFYRYFIASNYVNSVPAPHIKELSKKLMELALHGDGKHRLAVSMPPRHKLADSTPVLTYNRGWITHGELEVGDFVFGLDGEPTEIIGVSDKSICDRNITFSNGESILAHEGHLWGVHKRGFNEKKIQVLSTSDMESDFVIEKDETKRFRYHLPLINPIEYEDKDLLIDPYWLGYWLGDGTYNKPCISHSKEDSQFIDRVPYDMSSQYVHNDTGVYTTYFSNNDLIHKLKELNVYKNKHIPQCYKEASFKQRTDLLSGLIDSDGCVDESGRVRFINTNKRLIDDVYELCTGLGLYPYIIKYTAENINNYKKNNNSLDITAKKDVYHIGFQPRYNIPTSVPRKKIIKKGLRKKIGITNIEKTNHTELGKCIEIENEDGIYLVGKKLIPTHNSKSSMVTLAFPLWLIFQNPNLNIMIVTGSPKLAEKFGIQLREYVRELGHYFNIYLSNVKQASTHIMFCDKNGKLYRGNIMLATSGGGITGQDADYLILDDPYTGQDSEFTPTALQQKIDWVNRVIEQRIEPHTKYCVLHTRWHSRDIIGYYKETEPELYEFIEFPALKNDGTPLWNERYTLEELLKKKEIVGDRVFESVYQQKPIDTTSDFFNMQHLKFGLPEGYISQSMVRAWDIASSDALSSNDFTAGILMHRYDDYAIITDLVHGRFGGQTKTIVTGTANNDTPNAHIVIETGVAAAGELLYQEWKMQLRGYIVERAKVSGKGSKADRATPFKNAIEDGKVYINIEDPVSRESLLKELNGFPNLAHDDIIDACAHAYNYLFMNDMMGKKLNANFGIVHLW